MAHELSDFPTTEHTTPFIVQVGYNCSVIINGKGDVELLINVSVSSGKFVVRERLYEPSMQYSFIPVGILSCHGMQASFVCFVLYTSEHENHGIVKKLLGTFIY